MDDALGESFLAAAGAAAGLVRRPEVVARWEDESACSGMGIGGLACHLVSQVTNTVTLVGAPPSGAEPIPLLEH